jgi:hypothetical protein
MTPHEERKWRAAFKRRGYNVVREDHKNFRPLRMRDLTIVWLREQERADELGRVLINRRANADLDAPPNVRY